MGARLWGTCALSAAIFCIAAPADAGDIKWAEGHWRLELAGYGGLNSDRNHRSDDFGIVGTIEHEWPLWNRATLSLRVHPLFYYNQEQDDIRLFRRFRNDDNFNYKYNDDDVWGIGFGPAIRVYQNAEERRGLFLELGISALIHDNEFIDNSSSLNFVSEVGVGYKFSNDWHVVAKLRHISNAGLGDDNSANNGWGIGVGYTF